MRAAPLARVLSCLLVVLLWIGLHPGCTSSPAAAADASLASAAASDVDASGGWLPCDTGAAASLRGLAVVDRRIAYVGGSGGTILRTEDGGRSWQDVAPPNCGDCDFRDLEALDANRVLAMVAGQPARVYRTADGGRSWRIVHADPRPEAFFDAMARRGDQVVLFGDAIDGRFALLVSDDQGVTWRSGPGVVQALPRAAAGEAGFAASGTCVVGGGGGYSLVTGGGPARLVRFDVGAAGQPPMFVDEDLPLQRGGPSSGGFSVAWASERVLVVGGDYQRPELREGSGARSFDGGKTFAAVDVGGFRSAVVWLDDGQRALAVGSHGASTSQDAGATWQPFGSVGFHALAVAADGWVWACGSDGRVARIAP
ncbi:MAG: WD40/YVTN/BNR-like repeat-containing protein [Planctomycetota bacterium]